MNVEPGGVGRARERWLGRVARLRLEKNVLSISRGIDITGYCSRDRTHTGGFCFFMPTGATRGDLYRKYCANDGFLGVASAGPAASDTDRGKTIDDRSGARRNLTRGTNR